MLRGSGLETKIAMKLAQLPKHGHRPGTNKFAGLSHEDLNAAYLRIVQAEQAELSRKRRRHQHQERLHYHRRQNHPRHQQQAHWQAFLLGLDSFGHALKRFSQWLWRHHRPFMAAGGVVAAVTLYVSVSAVLLPQRVQFSFAQTHSCVSSVALLPNLLHTKQAA